MRRIRLRVIALALSVGLVLVACGGGDSEPGDNPVIGTQGVSTSLP